MSGFLLDVNVLIALVDPLHVFHKRATEWFVSRSPIAWAMCPLSQSGVLRILSSPAYVHSPGGPATVAEMLRVLQANEGYTFWPEDFDLLSSRVIDTDRLLSSAQVTDTCLLATAVLHDGHLATFDRKLYTGAVTGGADHLFLIP